MRTEISAEEAVAILREAFAPLHCGAEVFDYRYVRFRVFDESDEGLLRMERMTPDDYGFRKNLQMLIERARARVIQKGAKLEPWQMPPTAGA